VGGPCLYIEVSFANLGKQLTQGVQPDFSNSLSIMEINKSKPSTNMALKRQLVEEINLLLDDSNSQVSSIIRKAIRLADLCGDLEYRLLFDIHLDGADLTGSSGSRIEKWPCSDKKPKWDVTAAFYEDRLAPNGQSVGISLNEIESKLRQIPEMRARMVEKRNHIAANDLVQAELMFSDVLGRIQNRIGIYVRQVEKELSKSLSTSVQKPESNSYIHLSQKKVIVIISLAILIVLMTASALYLFKSSRSDSNELIKYAGRVVDINTNKAIRGAKVSVETKGVPQVYYTDSDGIFYLEISKQMDTPRVRVEAPGYEVFDRNVSITRTGLEDIRLTLVANDSTQRLPSANSGNDSDTKLSNGKAIPSQKAR
jgi:hypothetical protein